MRGGYLEKGWYGSGTLLKARDRGGEGGVGLQGRIHSAHGESLWLYVPSLEA